MKNISLRAGRFMALALVITGLGLGSCKKTETTTVYGNWTSAGLGSYSGPARSEAVSFVINNVAYAGTGRNPNASVSIFNDFYSFDPVRGGGWSRVTPMPTAAGSRYGAVAFAINGKGYVGGGRDINGVYLNDFWEFDPTQSTTITTTITNPTTGATTTTSTQYVGTWKAAPPMQVALYGAVGGSINNTGIVGCGTDGSNNLSDFYKFDGTRWMPITTATFPGKKRVGAFSFVVNNQFYVGGGTDNNAGVTDLVAYDLSTDKWIAKHYLRSVSNSTESYDYSGVARAQAVGFAINNKGYVTVGGNTLTSCYEYNPSDDTWTLKNPFNGSARNNAVGFGIGNYGYVALGANGSTRLDDFYRFAPNDAQE